MKRHVKEICSSYYQRYSFEVLKTKTEMENTTSYIKEDEVQELQNTKKGEHGTHQVNPKRWD